MYSLQHLRFRLEVQRCLPSLLFLACFYSKHQQQYAYQVPLTDKYFVIRMSCNASGARLDDAFLSAAVRKDASAHNINGLWPNFSSAATVLRIARSLGELDSADCDVGEEEKGSLDDFFHVLLEVEQELERDAYTMRNASNIVVVTIEGLDGSGKSLLIRNLGQGLKREQQVGAVHLYSTPPKSLSAVRPVFDKRGGPVARAFYMCCNYILQHEMAKQATLIHEESSTPGQYFVFLIDRFYSSTCAYTVGWKNTSGSAALSIGTLPDSIFKWPPNLVPPNVMLILGVNDATRRQRVASRADPSETSLTTAPSRHNPWDERLSNDEELGQRIMAAHYRSIGPSNVRVVDANVSPNQVADAALKIVQEVITMMDGAVLGGSSSNNNIHARSSGPITVAITGTHCSGKRTIGCLVADYFGWTFDAELGDVLRENDALVPDGHRSGDGSSMHNGREWDDRVHSEECKRDGIRPRKRVVETWHIGNLAWTLQRSSEKDIDSVTSRAYQAIREEIQRGTVLMVHLQSSPDASARRRRLHPENAQRLPMVDEHKECVRLHSALDVRVVELLQVVEDTMHVPLLVIDNEQDGEEAIRITLSRIADFVTKHI